MLHFYRPCSFLQEVLMVPLRRGHAPPLKDQPLICSPGDVFRSAIWPFKLPGEIIANHHCYLHSYRSSHKFQLHHRCSKATASAWAVPVPPCCKTSVFVWRSTEIKIKIYLFFLWLGYIWLPTSVLSNVFWLGLKQQIVRVHRFEHPGHGTAILLSTQKNCVVNIVDYS